MTARRGIQAAALLALAVLILGRWQAVATGNAWWAATLEIGATHAVLSRIRATLRVAALLVAIVWCVGNLLLVYRSIRSVHVPRRLGDLEILEAVPRRLLLLGAVAAGVLLAVALSHGAREWWYARTLGGVHAPLGVRDPVLGHDLSYYLFRLPWQRTLHSFATLLTGVLLATTTVLYAAVGAIRWSGRRLRVNELARWHLAFLAAAFALALLWGYRLEPAEYVAGVHDLPVDQVLSGVRIPVARMLSVLALVALGGTLMWLWTGRLVLIGVPWALLALGSFAGHYIVPSFAGAVRSSAELVLPDVEARRPQFEDIAYGAVTSDRPLDVVGARARGAWERGTELDGGVQWDAFAVTVLLNRVAAPELEHAFTEASLGIYRTSDGTAVPIYVAARVTNPAAARAAGQEVTWDDVHLGRYATARGAIAVRADAVAESGLPLYVPNTGTPEVSSAQVIETVLGDSTILVGPGVTDFAILPATGTRRGVPVGGFWRRLTLAWLLQSPRLITSNAVADSTIVVWHRDVVTRLERFAPFARFGAARAVVIDQRLFWVANGYVSARGFPLSPPVRWREQTVRYLRSSLVGVVDAASGETAVYLTREADPVTLAWAQLAPQVVRPATELPRSILPNVPYPEESLTAQIAILQRPTSGSTALEQPGPGPLARGSLVGQVPFWWVGTTSADTVPRLRLLVPIEGHESGLLAGLLDGTVRQSALVLERYRADRADEPLGPGQIARQFARLRGETVGIAGVMRMLPLAGGLAAVQSSYSSQGDGGAAPQLVDVAVSLSGAVGSGPSLQVALERLRADASPPEGDRREWTRARQWFDRMDAARRTGDWAAFGRAYDELRRLLLPRGDSIR